eukprot:763879-Hanusia_phi.AAC.2
MSASYFDGDLWMEDNGKGDFYVFRYIGPVPEEHTTAVAESKESKSKWETWTGRMRRKWQVSWRLLLQLLESVDHVRSRRSLKSGHEHMQRRTFNPLTKFGSLCQLCSIKDANSFPATWMICTHVRGEKLEGAGIPALGWGGDRS